MIYVYTERLVLINSGFLTRLLSIANQRSAFPTCNFSQRSLDLHNVRQSPIKVRHKLIQCCKLFTVPRELVEPRNTHQQKGQSVFTTFRYLTPIREVERVIHIEWKSLRNIATGRLQRAPPADKRVEVALIRLDSTQHSELRFGERKGTGFMDPIIDGDRPTSALDNMRRILNEKLGT